MIPSQLVRTLALASRKFNPTGLPEQFIASRPEKMLHRKNNEIDRLREEIKSLQLQLSVTQSPELQHKLDRLLFLVGDLDARATSHTAMKARHHERHHEIEAKIQLKKSQNDKELQKVQRAVASMEKKYASLERKGVDAQRLEPVRARIEQLKARIARKTPSDRADMTVRSSQPAQASRHRMFYPALRPYNDTPFPSVELNDEEPLGVLESSMPSPPSRKKHSFLRNLY